MLGISFKHLADIFCVGVIHSATPSMVSSTLGSLCYTTIAVAWNEFMQTLHSKVDDSHKLDKVHPLPFINSPAHEWTTLTTALDNLNQLMRTEDRLDSNEPTPMWLDMTCT